MAVAVAGGPERHGQTEGTVPERHGQMEARRLSRIACCFLVSYVTDVHHCFLCLFVYCCISFM